MPDRFQGAKWARPLAIAAIFVAALMTCFEITKQVLFPHISIWHSHAVTIAFTTLLSTIAGYFLVRRLVFLNEQSERVNDALRQSEARYRSLFERNRAGVFRSAPEGHFIDCNEAFARMFGYTPEELLRLSADVIYLEGKPEREARLAKFLKDRELRDDEVCYRRKDGSRMWAIQNVAIVEDENGRDVIEGTVVDVTERHQLEEKLRQSQKVEAIGRLAGGVAHDFNNLLGVIMGYCGLATKGLQQNLQARENIQRVEQAAQRAASLTHQLLAFGRKQWLQPKVINLNSLITNFDKMLRRLIGEDIELTTRAAPSLWQVKTDPSQIEQVVMNLVVNARDAMPRGGTLTLETANVELGQADAIEQGTGPGQYVMLAVSDSGEGMTPDTIAHLFEPFFTTKAIGKGTGLGLSTTYGIVKQSGGHIAVDSEVGLGTTFKIYFPRVDDVAETVSASPQPTTAVRGKETILVVEDDGDLRDLTRTVLTSYGYTVLAPDDLRALRPVMEKHAKNVNLLLTDIVMPGINGREVAEMLLKLNPQARVLYMSGYSGNTITQRGVLEDGGFFLAKPFTPATLGLKVREVLTH